MILYLESNAGRSGIDPTSNGKNRILEMENGEDASFLFVQTVGIFRRITNCPRVLMINCNSSYKSFITAI